MFEYLVWLISTGKQLLVFVGAAAICWFPIWLYRRFYSKIDGANEANLDKPEVTEPSDGEESIDLWLKTAIEGLKIDTIALKKDFERFSTKIEIHTSSMEEVKGRFIAIENSLTRLDKGMVNSQRPLSDQSSSSPPSETKTYVTKEDQAKENRKVTRRWIAKILADEIREILPQEFRRNKFDTTVDGRGQCIQADALVSLLDTHSNELSELIARLIRNREQGVSSEFRALVSASLESGFQRISRKTAEELYEICEQKETQNRHSRDKTFAQRLDKFELSLKELRQHFDKNIAEDWLRDKNQFQDFIENRCIKPAIENAASSERRFTEKKFDQQETLLKMRLEEQSSLYNKRISESVSIQKNVEEATRLLNIAQQTQVELKENSLNLERHKRELDDIQTKQQAKEKELSNAFEKLSNERNELAQREQQIRRLQSLYDPNKLPELLQEEVIQNELRSIETNKAEHLMLIGDISFLQSRLEALRLDESNRNIRQLQLAVHELGKTILRLANDGNSGITPGNWHRLVGRLVSTWFKLKLPAPGQPYNPKFMDNVKPGAVRKVNSWAVMPVDESHGLKPLAAQVD